MKRIFAAATLAAGVATAATAGSNTYQESNCTSVLAAAFSPSVMEPGAVLYFTGLFDGIDAVRGLDARDVRAKYAAVCFANPSWQVSQTLRETFRLLHLETQ